MDTPMFIDEYIVMSGYPHQYVWMSYVVSPVDSRLKKNIK